MTIAKTLVARLIAASHGHIPVDVAACPEWGYETVVYPARGTWSAALQTMIAGTVADAFGCCSACARDAEQEAMFISPRSVFAAAGDYLLHQVPSRVGPGAVVYECSVCWSDQIEFDLTVRRDPVTEAWLVESVEESGHWCLACGSSDCRPEPRAMRTSEQEKVKVELRRVAKDRAAEAADVRRVLAFVAGVRR